MPQHPRPHPIATQTHAAAGSATTPSSVTHPAQDWQALPGGRMTTGDQRVHHPPLVDRHTINRIDLPGGRGKVPLLPN